MSNLENDYETNCPYCSAALSVRVDHTAGKRQSFVIDCETCCRPIEIEIDMESDGTVNFIAKREGEG